GFPFDFLVSRTYKNRLSSCERSPSSCTTPLGAYGATSTNRLKANAVLLPSPVTPGNSTTTDFTDEVFAANGEGTSVLNKSNAAASPLMNGLFTLLTIWLP